MSKPSIVVVDDDRSTGRYLSDLLGSRGYEVEVTTDGDQLLRRLNGMGVPSLILLDVVLPGSSGIEIIAKIMKNDLKVPVIMLSGLSQVRTVVEAMNLGASDFLLKPVDEEALIAAVKKAIDGRLPRQPDHASEFVTANARMARLGKIIERVAPTDVPILLSGESGVGKEVMARHAHAHSGRGSKPFVKVNCAAMPDDLLESELFGYERGAFTGAVTDKPGKFEQAHTGTLLLDEIGEMSSHLQSKLLHILQDGTFVRLGGTKSLKVDSRIIAATNINIEKAIASGKFRDDLYFRLNVISIELPPLRERREDIPALCAYFIGKYRTRYNSAAYELPPVLLNSFMRHDWPGNIRQLENFIKRFLVLPDHHALLAEFDSTPEAGAPVSPAAPPQSMSLIEVGACAADRAEYALVQRVLAETMGNRKQAAKRMNICYKALLNKMKRWAPAKTMKDAA